MNNIIEISSVTKKFEVNTEYDNLFKRLFNRKKEIICAVDDVSIEIASGSMVALLGKNGAGKTTLIKMLAGIINPSIGEIQVGGYNPYKERYQYSYQIGVVLGQKSLLWYNIPVKESLNLYRNIYDISKKDFEVRLDFFKSLFDVEHLLDTPVRKLSLGERMKFEIVASLLHNPEILFLDEPTIGLDVLAKQQMYSFLKQINEEKNTTIILTTHNVDDVENLCERVILMDNGKIVYDGNQENLCSYIKTKTIVITGGVEMDEEIRPFLDKKDNGRYIFKCNQNNCDVIAKIMSKMVPGSDIFVSGADIEDILLQVYGGKLIF